MPFQLPVSKSKPTIRYNFADETATLGGLLTLAAEACATKRLTGSNETRVEIWIRDKFNLHKSLAFRVFSAIDIVFDLVPSPIDEDGDFLTSLGAPTKSASFETLRLNWIHQSYGVKPVIDWKANSSGAGFHDRHDKSTVTFGVHLKSIAPYKLQESNADPRVWQNALAFLLRELPINLLFLGNDRTVIDVNSLPRGKVSFLGHLSIENQLQAAKSLDGFVGMASGLASFAMYSEIPFHIYKHPLHHAEAMVREFGDIYQIPFWHAGQLMHRVEVTAEQVVNDVSCLLKSI